MNVNSQQLGADLVPEIFTAAREYRNLPEALEAAQATFNEEALYAGIAGLAHEWSVQRRRPARVLDLCAATGWAAFRIASAIPVSEAVLVDIDSDALHRAHHRLQSVCPVRLHVGDAAMFRSNSDFDIICLNSAYHHIEDNRKVTFLKNVRRHLGLEGVVLMGEHFLPEFKNGSYRLAILKFYEALLADLKARSEPESAIAVIRRSGLYGWEGIYEYKTSFGIALQHFREADLQCTTIHKVWPELEGTLPRDSGSFFMTLQRAETKNARNIAISQVFGGAA